MYPINIKLKIQKSDGTEQELGPVTIPAGPAGFPCKTIETVEFEPWYEFATTSWDDIEKIIAAGQQEKYFKIGDTKNVIDSSLKVRIRNFDSVLLEGYKSYKGINLEFVDCIASTAIVINDTSLTTYNYTNTTMGTEITNFYNYLKTTEKDNKLWPHIKKVNKSITNITNAYNTHVLDYLHPYSYNELTGLLEQQRIKRYAGNIVNWWYANNANGNYYKIVNTEGMLTYTDKNNQCGIGVVFTV